MNIGSVDRRQETGDRRQNSRGIPYKLYKALVELTNLCVLMADLDRGFRLLPTSR